MFSGEHLLQQVPAGSRKGPHLHEGVTLQRKGSTGDLSEAPTHVGQGAGPQDLWLVVHDERQSYTEENLGAFVEETVPDPQDRLQGKETTGGFGKDPHQHAPVFLSPQWGERPHRGRWTIGTPPASICQDTGPSAVPRQEISSSPARWAPPHPPSDPTWTGCNNLSDNIL